MNATQQEAKRLEEGQARGRSFARRAAQLSKELKSKAKSYGKSIDLVRKIRGKPWVSL